MTSSARLHAEHQDVIERFQLWRVRVPLKATITSSRGSLDHGEKVILQLTTRAGATGLGESSVIFPGRSGENAATIFVTLRDVYAPKLLGGNPVHVERLLESLTPLSSEQYAFLATLCAIDLALHDLKARLLDLPLADLLGGASRTRLPLSRSLSIMPDDELVATSKALAQAGYRLLTLKGTRNWRADIRSFERVRASLPAEVDLEFDPNQAWTAKGTLEVDRALAPLGLVCIEQPCAWWDLEAMRFVTERSQTPIAADETVLSPADAMRVIRLGAADIINLKLAKSGGICNSTRIVHLAEAAGLECNIGSKHPLGIGSAALLHFSAAVPAVGEFIGYGSALERFVGDVINEEISIEHGEAVLPVGPGLGVTLDEPALQRFAVETFDSASKGSVA
ncbi:MAG: hypothetical protein NTV11_19370 [Rhodocyclales bacterium]|nr:hypothetical protein [Rhodocyclales bacterium]